MMCQTYAEFFTCIISFNFQTKPLKKLLLHALVYVYPSLTIIKKVRFSKLKDPSQITNQARGRAKINTQPFRGYS